MFVERSRTPALCVLRCSSSHRTASRVRARAPDRVVLWKRFQLLPPLRVLHLELLQKHGVLLQVCERTVLVRIGERYHVFRQDLRDAAYTGGDHV